MHTVKQTVKMINVFTNKKDVIPVKNFVAEVIGIHNGDTVDLAQVFQLMRGAIVDCILQDYYSVWRKNEYPVLNDIVHDDYMNELEHKMLMDRVDAILSDAEKAIADNEGILKQAQDAWMQSEIEKNQPVDSSSKSDEVEEPKTKVSQLWNEIKKRGLQ
jgi:hypothetical protein